MVIKIHIYLFLVIAYMFAIQNLEMYMYTYIFVVMHEIAHIAVSYFLNVEICEIELLPVGINAKYIGKISKIKELIISIAGPIASFLFYIFLNNNLLKKINLLIAIMNLIPLKPYDGGRIITSFMSFIIGEEKANKISISIQKKSMNILMILSIVSVFFLKNYYLAILCIYMICIMKEELKNERFNELINYLQID